MKRKINTSDFYKFENPNDKIEGVLKAIEPSKKFVNEKTYIFDTPTGEKRLGGNKMLENHIKPEMVGKKMEILFLGKKKSVNGNTYNNYDIFIDE